MSAVTARSKKGIPPPPPLSPRSRSPRCRSHNSAPHTCTSAGSLPSLCATSTAFRKRSSAGWSCPSFSSAPASTIHPLATCGASEVTVWASFRASWARPWRSRHSICDALRTKSLGLYCGTKGRGRRSSEDRWKDNTRVDYGFSRSPADRPVGESPVHSLGAHKAPTSHRVPAAESTAACAAPRGRAAGKCTRDRRTLSASLYTSSAASGCPSATSLAASVRSSPTSMEMFTLRGERGRWGELLLCAGQMYCAGAREHAWNRGRLRKLSATGERKLAGRVSPDRAWDLLLRLPSQPKSIGRADLRSHPSGRRRSCR